FVMFAIVAGRSGGGGRVGRKSGAGIGCWFDADPIFFVLCFSLSFFGIDIDFAMFAMVVGRSGGGGRMGRSKEEKWGGGWRVV
ncbi:hypothetical protein BDZ91DRAFT_738442, partial [Kalaharituber pfeilii]